MKYLLKAFLASFALFCSFGFVRSYIFITVQNPGSSSPSFTLQTSRTDIAPSDPIELNSFAVYPKIDGELDFGSPAWEIKASGDVNPSIKVLNYGQIPAGFYQGSPPQALVPGRQYYVMGRGVGEAGGISFTH